MRGIGALIALLVLLGSCVSEDAVPVDEAAPSQAVIPTQTAAPPPAPPTAVAPEWLPTAVRRAPTPVSTPAPATPVPTPTPLRSGFDPGQDIVYSVVTVPPAEGDIGLLGYLSEAMGRIEGTPLPYSGLYSLEEMVLLSDVIARTFVKKSPGVDLWSALLEFRFQVHEYLKGTGPSEIGGLVYILDFDNEAMALKAMSQIGDVHDSRWDTREAIVFLTEEDKDSWYTDFATESDQYWFGKMAWESLEQGWGDAYTVASVYRKSWLPEASASSVGARSTSASEKMFLLDAPAAGARGGLRAAQATSTLPTISISAMKNRISTLEAEANVGGTPAYRGCVLGAYGFRRHMLQLIQKNGSPVWQKAVSMESGQPAGTVLYDREGVMGVAPTSTMYVWYDGPDRDVVEHRAVDIRPRPGHPGQILHTSRTQTARPLPADTYAFFHNWRPSACEKRFPEVENQHRVDVTVSAPDGTLHEAFFDPVDIGDAVGADGSNGVIEPASFTVNGADTTISSLKWEGGSVSLGLNPTASMAGYALDFIDTTGTTTLSLKGNAELTWPVADKPWADGDLLMLRIHRPISTDATLSALTLSGVDLAFSAATTTYAASVPATTTQTTVTPTTNHDSATYVVKLADVFDADGTITLAAGANVITVEVTAEDGSTTQTYSVTITRATPTEPITVTLTPRTEGLTFFDLTVQWDDPQACDGLYFVYVGTERRLIRNLGFHAPTVSTVTSSTGWLYDNVPDFWAVVRCDPSDYGASREVGRASLRAALE